MIHPPVTATSERAWLHRSLMWMLTLGGTWAFAVASAQGLIRLSPAVSGLQSPADITNARDGSGRLFIVEQPGRIRIAKNGQLLATPLLDVTSLVQSGGEQGLLGLAFHPKYRDNGEFFVFYSVSPRGTAVSRFRVSKDDPDRADPSSEEKLLEYPRPYGNHNGGSLHFGWVNEFSRTEAVL